MESEQRVWWDKQQQQKQLILLTTPLQGHITPMLHLASLLSSAGFSVTIVHPRLNSPDASSHPTIRFLPIADGISPDHASDVDFMLFADALNRNCEAPFRECVARLVAEDSSPPVAGLIDDGLMKFVPSVARDFGLPWIMLFANSAAALAAYLSLPLLSENGYFPIKDPTSQTVIPESPPLRIKDLPDIGSDDPEAWFKFAASVVKEIMASASAVCWNTFHPLEDDCISNFKQAFQKPVFAIGPLHKHPTSSFSSLIIPDRSCLPWLDKQAPSSVLYVSFGSLASITTAQLEEAAWGLANSGQPFLWAVRRGVVRGTAGVDLPEKFEEETGGRGMVANWVPQEEVLAHRAVGGFWTHCGWNSTLESICEGVPMLCWPSFGDQRVNARYVSHVWKVGLQLECAVLDRGEVERGIRRLMVEKEGDEFRGRAQALKEDAACCFRDDGPTARSLKQMVDYFAAR